VRDRRLRSTDYLAICSAQLPAEHDLDILEVVFERVAWAITRYVPEARREAEAHAWFELALRCLAGAAEGDEQILWARSAIRAATGNQDVTRLVALVDGSETVGGFGFDQEMRWAVTVKAIANGLADGDRLLAQQSQADPSDRGRRAMLQAEAARPSAAAKRQVWDRIHGEGYGSFHLTRAAMMGFFWPQQEDVLAPFADLFFGQVRDVFEKHDHPFARAYIQSLFPAYRADPRVLVHARQLMSELDGSLPTLSRQLAESADELDRQIKVRAFAETG
jgi:aminopeptidase N